MYDKLLEASLLLVVGMGVVFTSLFFFFLLISAIKFVDEKLNTRKVGQKLSIKNETKSPEERITPEIVAIITAAAMEAFQKPIRIKKIHFLDSQDVTPWARFGRQNILGSHLLKR